MYYNTGLYYKFSIIKEFGIFLELNPKVRHFATDDIFHLANSDPMIKSKMELNSLAVCIQRTDQINLIFNVLNRLYENGAYKQLHLYFPKYIDIFDELMTFQLVAVKALEKLTVGRHSSLSIESISKIPSSFSNVKEPIVDVVDNIENLETIAREFINLKHLDIYQVGSYLVLHSTFQEIEIDKYYLLERWNSFQR